MNSTEFLNQCYIKDLVDEWIYKFQLMPNEITLEKGTNWEDVEIPGRSVPLKFYRSSNSEKLLLNLQLVTSMFQGDNAEAMVYQAIRNLKSMPYPDYSGRYVKPPHKYLIVISNTFNDPTFDMYQYIAVCRNVRVTYKLPYDFTSGRSMYVEVQADFEEVRDEPYDLNIIRGV